MLSGYTTPTTKKRTRVIIDRVFVTISVGRKHLGAHNRYMFVYSVGERESNRSAGWMYCWLTEKCRNNWRLAGLYTAAQDVKALRHDMGGWSENHRSSPESIRYCQNYIYMIVSKKYILCIEETCRLPK